MSELAKRLSDEELEKQFNKIHENDFLHRHLEACRNQVPRKEDHDDEIYLKLAKRHMSDLVDDALKAAELFFQK